MSAIDSTKFVNCAIEEPIATVEQTQGNFTTLPASSSGIISHKFVIEGENQPLLHCKVIHPEHYLFLQKSFIAICKMSDEVEKAKAAAGGEKVERTLFEKIIAREVSSFFFF